MRTAPAALFAIGLASLTSCSSPPSASSPAPVGAPSASASTAPSFDTAATLMDALRSKGIPCTGFKIIPGDQYDPRALQSAFCTTTDHSELNVSIYANTDDASSAPQRLFDQPAQSFYGSYAVVGDKWCVAVAEKGTAWLAKVQQAIGGKIVTIPKTK